MTPRQQQQQNQKSSRVSTSRVSTNSSQQQQQQQQQRKSRANNNNNGSRSGTYSSLPLSSSLGRLQAYEERITGMTQFDRDEMLLALGMQKYYFPWNNDNWWSDLVQYMTNNHPVFGICCHHPYHPVRFGMRIWSLIGSIMFGICITNCMWLWFYYYDTSHNYTDPVLILNIKKDFGLHTNNNNTTHDNESIWNKWIDEQNEYDEIRITQGMVLLWTVGGLLHSIYDCTIWYLDACICCLPRSYNPRVDPRNFCQKTGRTLVISITITCTAIATLIVVLRASFQANNKDIIDPSSSSTSETNRNFLNVSDIDPTRWFGIGTDDGTRGPDTVIGIQKASEYNFLLSYTIETALALLLYYPITVTILFSGYLGCGAIPILGGRPYDKKQHYRRKMKYEQQQQQQSRSSSSNNNNIPENIYLSDTTDSSTTH